MIAQPVSDLERLRTHLARFARAEDRTELAEILGELLEASVAPDLALVVFHHPAHGRPTVFGGTFDQRRVVGRTLRRRSHDSDAGRAALGSAIGPSVRVIRIGEAEQPKGMILVGNDQRALRADEIEYVHFLAGCASDTLTRLGLHSRIDELAEELHTSVASLDQQDRLRLMGQVADRVAADVNAALSPITAYSALLLATEQDAETRRYIELIQQAGADVAEIVRSLRTFYPDREDAPTGFLDMARIVGTAIDRVGTEWSQERSANVVIDDRIAEGLPIIEGAQDPLVEALVNLLYNAAEALGATGGTIRVLARVESGATGGDEVVLSVEDDGPGMDADTLERCTELFFTTRGQDAAGIGLTQVRRAARDAGGRFEISSSPGQGTRARVFVPVSKSQDRIRLVRTSRPEQAAEPARILCIDDDAAVLQLLHTMFERDGHVVSTVTGGRAGVEAFVEGVQTNRPWDLVITDLEMSDLHGFGVIRAIRATDPDVPVLMLTAWMQQLPVDLTDLPGLRVQSKPFDVIRVRQEIRDMLDAAAPAASTGRSE